MARAWHAVARWYSIPLLLALWQAAVALGMIQSRLLPSPLRIGAALATDVRDGILLYHATVTFARALSGFALAAIVGIPFAALMSRSSLCRNLFEPMFFLGYPVPKIALFPVFTYIFGIGSLSKVSFTFLECLYPIVVTCFFGFRGINARLIWTAQNLGASRSIILRRVIFPAAMPSIFAGLRVALPLAITIVVITEMIGDSVGLGYYITIWSTRFTFANVYAAIFVIGACGFVLDQGLLFLRRRAVYWEREKR